MKIYILTFNIILNIIIIIIVIIIITIIIIIDIIIIILDHSIDRFVYENFHFYASKFQEYRL